MSSCAGLENPPNGVAGDNGLKGKTILITGGLGFVGKLLTEKVLRTCPLVRKIYLLIRDKKENKAETRLNEIFKDAVSITDTYTITYSIREILKPNVLTFSCSTF